MPHHDCSSSVSRSETTRTVRATPLTDTELTSLPRNWRKKIILDPYWVVPGFSLVLFIPVVVIAYIAITFGSGEDSCRSRKGPMRSSERLAPNIAYTACTLNNTTQHNTHDRDPNMPPLPPLTDRFVLRTFIDGIGDEKHWNPKRK